MCGWGFGHFAKWLRRPAKLPFGPDKIDRPSAHLPSTSGNRNAVRRMTDDEFCLTLDRSLREDNASLAVMLMDELLREDRDRFLRQADAAIHCGTYNAR